MGLLDQLEARFLQPIIDAIKRWLGPFGKLVDLVSQFFEKVKKLVPDTFQLGKDIYAEIQAWKKFKEDIHFRTGVVSLPAAIEQTQALIDEIVNAWHVALALIQKLKDKAFRAGEADPAVEAEEAATELEQGGGSISKLLAKFPKLAKGLEKIVAWLAIVVTVLDDMIEVVGDLKTLLQTITDIREEIETGKTVFLSQTNRRQIVHLDDGTSMKIRVGSLHPE